MSEARGLLAETLDKLFASEVTLDVLRKAEAGVTPANLADRIAALGLDDIFKGGSDDPWRDAFVVLIALGRYVVPLPVAEGVLAPAPLDPHLKGAAMRATQMAGAIERALDITVEYARARVQFGKPIGSFQAIQQQLAIVAGQSAAASAAAAAAFETLAREEDPWRDIAVAKLRAGEAAGIVCGIVHQVHGAIGFTDEYILHHFTRRLWKWRAEFGNESEWSVKLGDWALSQGADGFWPAIATRA